MHGNDWKGRHNNNFYLNFKDKLSKIGVSNDVISTNMDTSQTFDTWNSFI